MWVQQKNLFFNIYEMTTKKTGLGAAAASWDHQKKKNCCIKNEQMHWCLCWTLMKNDKYFKKPVHPCSSPTRYIPPPWPSTWTISFGLAPWSRKGATETDGPRLFFSKLKLNPPFILWWRLRQNGNKSSLASKNPVYIYKTS